MKHLLLPLLTSLAIPTAAIAQGEFIGIKAPNPYSYKQSSLVRWETQDSIKEREQITIEVKGSRYLSFKGTTNLGLCFNNSICASTFIRNQLKKGVIEIDQTTGNLVWDYEINCKDKSFNKKGDLARSSNIRFDLTAQVVANKFCPIDAWSKLPERPRY